MPPYAPTDDTQGNDTMPPPPDAGAQQDTEGIGGMSPSDEVCIPLSALASPDDQQKMNNPEEGDMVDWRSTGTVTRIEGENAYVRPTSVNAQPIQGADGSKSDDQEETELQGMAAQMPGPQ